MQHNKDTALITGASSGIGAVYADRLARRGHNLILVARDKARLTALAATLREETGVEVDVLAVDLSQAADLRRVEDVLRSDGSIGLLVNNAGIADTGTLADSQPERIDAMVALNVLALTRLAAAATASFLQRGRGTVVNVASVVALAPEMFNASYSATKAYVLSLSQTLQHEVGQHGVHVQAVLPGITRTEIWERTGMTTDQLPASMIMEAGELVDAALAGLDQGETITIPSLPDPADWEAFVAARNRLGPNLSHNHPAARYGLGT